MLRFMCRDPNCCYFEQFYWLKTADLEEFQIFQKANNMEAIWAVALLRATLGLFYIFSCRKRKRKFSPELHFKSDVTVGDGFL